MRYCSVCDTLPLVWVQPDAARRPNPANYRIDLRQVRSHKWAGRGYTPRVPGWQATVICASLAAPAAEDMHLECAWEPTRAAALRTLRLRMERVSDDWQHGHVFLWPEEALTQREREREVGHGL